MTVWTPADDGYADLTSHDSFASGAPHNTFTRLRREDPCAWTEYPGGAGFWSLTRHADIAALNRDYRKLSSARGIRMEDQTEEEYLARRTFQETDPPEHTRVRMKVARAFSRPVVNAFEAEVARICDEILDEALETREFDATRVLARPLPMRMLGRILGLPEADLPWLVEKGDALIANTDPDFTTHVLDRMETDEYRLMPFNSPAGVELYDYAERLMAEKAKAGDETGVLHLVTQPDETGARITEREFRNFFCLLVAAGNDTTRYSIAAGLLALAEQPELLGQLREGGAIWETMADEVIRWATPAIYFRRTAGEDFELHGKRIAKGDKVLLWFASANRDEATFADPFRVDLRRDPNPHLSFGQGGPHICLGIWLARLEVRVFFQRFAARVKAVERTGPHAFLRSNFVGGVKSLPLRVTPA